MSLSALVERALRAFLEQPDERTDRVPPGQGPEPTLEQTPDRALPKEQ